MNTQPPSLSITMVSLTVPIAGGDIHLEIGAHDCRVWDGVGYTLCGQLFPFDTDGHHAHQALYGDAKLTDIPHFSEVFAYLSQQHAANRANPLGVFIRPAVEAMERALAERDGSCVYFAEADGRVKIGWSRKVATRIAQLQTGSAAPITLLGTTPGGVALERRLHQQFAAARVAGEWFEATPELRAYVEALP